MKVILTSSVKLYLIKRGCSMRFKPLICFLVFLGLINSIFARDVVNIYTSRHYTTDKEIYKRFTEQTGVIVREISAKDQILLERLKNEGENSPADVLILSDAARLWRATQAGLFQKYKNKLIDERIPKSLRSKDNWIGLTIRARIIVYDKRKFNDNDISTYSDLGKPLFKNEFCSRSITHPYMLSLLSSLILNLGEIEAKTLSKNLVLNQARKPQGGDTDQIRAVGSGECGVALTNSYYLIRLMRSTKPRDIETMKNVGFLFPNQEFSGTHINVTGAGILKNAPNPKNGKLFLTFLTESDTQKMFAFGNNEWPAIKGLKTNNQILDNLKDFKKDKLNIETIGSKQFTAQKIADQVGWQ